MRNYLTARTFAREYGTLLGGAWIVMFAGALTSVRTGNAFASIVMILGGVACLILPFFFALRYKNKPFNVEEGITFFHAVYFSFIMYFYASMIAAATTFIYFQWMDNGAFIDGLYAAIDELEKNQQNLPQGMPGMLIKEKALIDEIASLDIKPIEQALAMFNQCLFCGIIGSLLTSFFAKREPGMPTPPPMP